MKHEMYKAAQFTYTTNNGGEMMCEKMKRINAN